MVAQQGEEKVLLCWLTLLGIVTIAIIGGFFSGALWMS
jgi:hypothetical protein